MFPTRYFPDRMFAPRFFPKVGEDASAEPVTYCLEKSAAFVPGLEAFATERYYDEPVSFIPGGRTIKNC